MDIYFPRDPGIPSVAKPAPDCVISDALLEEEGGMGVPERMGSELLPDGFPCDLFKLLIKGIKGYVFLVFRPAPIRIREPVGNVPEQRIPHFFFFNKKIYVPDDVGQLLLDGDFAH